MIDKTAKMLCIDVVSVNNLVQLGIILAKIMLDQIEIKILLTHRDL